ncbi:ribosome small subunit-dependent GTPase A [Quadrisphaera sp. GCM10027208]|uniref:ribosome small subunit-dependent GTPase A n=1 Tax=Quadrisphaera sp. GCM10027208 TaxID=3273423 RepID=UPI00361056E5
MTPRSTRRLDESDVRIRPNPRGSRPRTKDRPRHEDAVTGRVLTVDRGRYTTLVDEDGPTERVVVAMRAREIQRTGIVVGDRVGVVGDVSGTTDALARIVRVQPRATVLRRTADDSDPVERVVVANADQLVVVTSVADPAPRHRMVDRALVAAYDAGITPLLCLTKADLADPAPFLAAYRDLDLTTLVTRRRPDGSIDGVEDVRARLTGHETVLLGHSGVGKSTLVNALVPDADRATGSVNAVTGRGRHTSSSAVALRLPGRSGWVTDTPGIRSFGLAHVQPQHLLRAFEDLEPGSAGCPRGCSHDEPDCALDAWVEAGNAGPHGRARLDSLRRLLRSRTEADG